MVRCGGTPLRVLSLLYGADGAYTEELIDHKLSQCTRVVNDHLGTVDFVFGDSTVLRIDPAMERGRVILQIGSSSAERALAAALLTQDDVAGIDINMGCPKKFSTEGGMGSRLLRKPELACEIVRTLHDNVRVPVTAKIRLLDTVDTTARFMHGLEEAGAQAIAVHCRFVDDRPQRHRAKWELLRELCAKHRFRVPIYGNGDVLLHADIERMCRATGVAGVLIARGAIANPSVFRSLASAAGSDEPGSSGCSAAEASSSSVAVPAVSHQVCAGSCSSAVAAAALTDVTGVASARAADPEGTVRDRGMLPADVAARHYVKLCVRYDAPLSFVKYTLTRMVPGKSVLLHAMHACRDVHAVARAFDIDPATCVGVVDARELVFGGGDARQGVRLWHVTTKQFLASVAAGAASATDRALFDLLPPHVRTADPDAAIAPPDVGPAE